MDGGRRSVDGGRRSIDEKVVFMFEVGWVDLGVIVLVDFIYNRIVFMYFLVGCFVYGYGYL